MVFKIAGCANYHLFILNTLQFPGQRSWSYEIINKSMSISVAPSFNWRTESRKKSLFGSLHRFSVAF